MPFLVASKLFTDRSVSVALLPLNLKSNSASERTAVICFPEANVVKSVLLRESFVNINTSPTVLPK